MACEVNSRKEVFLCAVNVREMRVYLGSRCARGLSNVEGGSRIFLLPYFLTSLGRDGYGRAWTGDADG